MITLRLKQQPNVPLEAEAISPDRMLGQSNEAIRGLPIHLGKRHCRLDDFFDVDGADSDVIEIHGDVSKVKWIGREMSRGHIKIHGNVGMHLGAHMKGGTIEVTGNASDWIGAEMRHGLIRVSGNAGGQVGAAYRGSLAGMKGGAIVIGGSAGLEVGMRMKRGIIVVQGPVRDFAGLQMKGGTLFLCGGAEIRTGAWMFRGTIVSFTPIKLLPTFSYAATYSPTFLRVYAKHLEQLGATCPLDDGPYARYSGDSSVPGKGEILVRQGQAATAGD